MAIDRFPWRAGPRDSRLLRAVSVLLDLLVIAFVAAGTYALLTDGSIFRVAGVRVTLRTAWRPYLWAAALLVARYWLVRQPALGGLLGVSARALTWLVTSVAATVRSGLSTCVTLGARGGRAVFSFASSASAATARDARQPFVAGEPGLFQLPERRLHRIGRLSVLVLAFAALVVVLTWPQARDLHSVPDLGDPLFSIWRISWVNRQIFHDPARLFDANIFYPERLTLTYSDPIIVPALMAAPLFWMGVHKVVAYNLLFLSGFVLSGVTMFVLTRALTNRPGAAAIAGVIFAVYPFRYEHYSHLEMQMTMWMPLALWGLHRTVARGRWRDGIVTGVAFGLQSLSSLYYGCFMAVYLFVVGGALWLARGRPARPVGALVAGALLAALMIAPVGAQYVSSRRTIGARSDVEVRFYSAQARDYLTPQGRSLLYGRWAENGHPERSLFPHVMPVALTAVALWPPLSAPRIAYTLGFVVALDGSLGYNGITFPWLRTHLSTFRNLRVPARFSIVTGLTLAILAGYGAARLLERWPRRHRVLTGVMLALVIVEALPRLALVEVWRAPPAIYASFDGKPPSVLAEFPMPAEPLNSPLDARYLYFSTFHWQQLVNGNSGFLPGSYVSLLEHERGFPSDAAVAFLRTRGVEYVSVHGAFYPPARFADVVRALDARSDVQLVAAAPWFGSESRLYRLH